MDLDGKVSLKTFSKESPHRLNQAFKCPVLTLLGVIEVADTCSPGARLIRLPVVQLAWRYNEFFLRFYSVRVSSLAMEGLEQFRGWFEKRMTRDDPRFYESLNLPPGLCKSLPLISSPKSD